MLTYIAIYNWLKEVNKTHEEMEAIWSYMIERNRLAQQLEKSGVKWYTLAPHLRKDLLRKYNEEISNGQTK